jgi:hypothetical protein
MRFRSSLHCFDVLMSAIMNDPDRSPLTKSSIVENSIPSCMSVSIASLRRQPTGPTVSPNHHPHDVRTIPDSPRYGLHVYPVVRIIRCHDLHDLSLDRREVCVV